MIDNYEEVYKDEILFRFFMDAPAMLCQDGIIRSRRELLEQYEFEEDDEIYERLMSSRASYTAALTQPLTNKQSNTSSYDITQHELPGDSDTPFFRHG